MINSNNSSIVRTNNRVDPLIVIGATFYVRHVLLHSTLMLLFVKDKRYYFDEAEIALHQVKKGVKIVLLS